LVALVLVDEPEVNVYGGVVAAPVFRNIAQGALRHLAVAPQKPDLLPTTVGQAELPVRRAPKKEAEITTDGVAAPVPEYVSLSAGTRKKF
jgi:cell division protein FtsI (penicillin-binding protein 3)